LEWNLEHENLLSNITENMIIRLAEEKDIQDIINLQGINTYERLTESEKKNGFVTTPFTSEQLERLIFERGLFVLEIEAKIQGYTMAASWDYFSQWPIFPVMLSKMSGNTFEGITISSHNTFQYGPICIDACLRGTNAFPCLFEKMRKEFSSRYSVGLTFINTINKRSNHAHTRKLDLIVMDEFEFSGREYYGLAFNTERSVL